MNRKKTIVMLGDFGISKQLSTITQASSLVGTPNYLSQVYPTLQINLISLDRRSARVRNTTARQTCKWALGCVLFEMVELRRAFEGDLPLVFKNITTSKPCQRLNKNVSKDVETLISMLLMADPKLRLDADRVVSYPCVLRTCIDLSLDLGRVENKEIEELVASSIYSNNDTVKLPRSLPATLTISQLSTLAASQQNTLLRPYTIQGNR